MAHSSARILAGAAFLFVLFCASPARADLITVDWDVTPHDQTFITYGDSPYYECFGSSYPDRLCQWLWQDGLQIEATVFSFFDDKWIELWDDDTSVQRIRPVCKAGLAPCFDLFTPVTMRVEGPSMGGAVNLYISSSRGGLIQIPEIDLLPSAAVINFSGDQWTNLEWLEIGVYEPDECKDSFPEEPPHACIVNLDHALWLQDLTFSPVPEPPLAALLGVAAAAAGGRIARSRIRRRRAL